LIIELAVVVASVSFDVKPFSDSNQRFSEEEYLLNVLEVGRALAHAHRPPRRSSYQIRIRSIVSPFSGFA
jgi:hypothetical protein